MIVGELSAPIRGDTSIFRRDLQNVRSMGTKLSSDLTSGMKNFGNSLKDIGANLTKFITVPLIGASIAVFKLGKDFEKEMSKITGLVGVSKNQVDLWAKEIINIAPELGKAPMELAEALFFVTSAGLRGSDAMDVLKMAAKASTAGLGETKVIADLVTSAMNAYGSENLSAATATDILVAAVREGKAEASELAASMGQVLPLASELGVTFDQVAATQAAMTKTGTNASEAATQLKSIMAGLIKPSKQAEEQLDAMGTSSSEMRKKIKDEGLLQALMDLREMTNKYGEEAMARVFPNIRALMGVLDLMGSNLESNKKTFDEVANSTGSLDKAFQSASETLDFKWNQALGNIKSKLLGFFDIVKSIAIPILENFIKAMDFVSDKFSNLSPNFKKAMVGITASIGLIGPVIAAVGLGIATFAGLLGGVIAAITTIAGVISTVGLPLILALGAAFVVVGGEIALFVAGIIAVVGGLIASFRHAWNTNDEFRNKVIETWTSIKETAKQIFSEIKIFIKTIFNAIQGFWKVHGDDIISMATIVWNMILGTIKYVMYMIRDVIKLVNAIIKGDWGKAWAAIKSIVINATKLILKGILSMKSLAISYFSSLGKVAANLIVSMVNKIGNVIKNLLPKGVKAGKYFIAGLTSTNYKQAGIKIVAGIIEGIKAMFGEVDRVTRALATKIRDYFPFSPAKEGPLKDLNKLNFSGPIKKSLDKAKSIVNDSLGNINLGVSGSIPQTQLGGGVNFYGNMYFDGVTDMPGFLNEMKKTIQSQTGKRLI